VSAPCGRPLEWLALVDYWFGDEEGHEHADANERVEEHLLGCDWCSGRLHDLAALGAGVRQLARRGGVEMIVTPSFLEWAAREGLRIREYRVPPGGRVACTVTPEDDLLVGRLQCRFTGVSRLDLVWQVEGGSERRIDDVPISPDAAELILVPAMPEMRLMRHATWRARLLAREAGGERLLGEYTFAHALTEHS
jgi:hypothetical protein